MKRRLCLIVGLLVIPATLIANETRRHYLVVSKDMKPAYEVTRIHADNGSSTTRSFLIADPRGPLLRVDVIHDYVNSKTVTTLKALRGSRTTAHVSIDLPFSSTTREGRQKEIKEHPELFDAAVPVTVEGAQGKAVHELENAWHRPESAENVRVKARDALGAELAAMLGEIKELAGLPMFADLNASLGYFLDEHSLVRRSSKLLVANDKINCAFDLSFGAPCAP